MGAGANRGKRSKYKGDDVVNYAHPAEAFDSPARDKRAPQAGPTQGRPAAEGDMFDVREQATAPVRVRAAPVSTRGAGQSAMNSRLEHVELGTSTLIREVPQWPPPAPSLPKSKFEPVPMSAGPVATMAGTSNAASSRGRGGRSARVASETSPLRRDFSPEPAAPLSQGASEQAAMAAILASLPGALSPPCTLGSPSETYPSISKGGIHAKGAPNPWRKGWSTEVPIDARRVMIWWLKHARQRTEAARRERENRRAAARAAAAAKEAAKVRRANRRDRTDRLVQLYLDNQVELERLCLEEPISMLDIQMSVLTRRIDSLTSETNDERNFAGVGSQGWNGKHAAASDLGNSRSQKRFFGQDLSNEASGRNPEDFELPKPIEEVFDEAMRKQDELERNRDKVNRQAYAQAAKMWQTQLKAQVSAEKNALAAAKKAKADLIEQLRAERERLAALKPLFDAGKRRQQRREEQQSIDLVESMQEARRKAEEQHLAEMRERRRRAEEEKRRQEEESRRREEEERQRIAEQEARKLREEMRLRQEAQLREEAKRQAEEEEDRVRQEMEELQRLRLQEQRRLEEQRQAEEAKRRQKQEAEESKRVAQRAAHVDDAFGGLESACNDTDAVEDWMAREDPQAATQKPKGAAKSSGARDFMAKALAALGDDDDDDSSGSEFETEGAGQLDVASDMELLRVSEAIGNKIAAAHREGG